MRTYGLPLPFKSGYHVYRDIWVAVIGEELSCVWETDNYRDPFAVAVAISGIIVGHVPDEGTNRERGPRGSGSVVDLSEV